MRLPLRFLRLMPPRGEDSLDLEVRTGNLIRQTGLTRLCPHYRHGAVVARGGDATTALVASHDLRWWRLMTHTKTRFCQKCPTRGTAKSLSSWRKTDRTVTCGGAQLDLQSQMPVGRLAVQTCVCCTVRRTQANTGQTERAGERELLHV